jgi:ribonuclease III
MDLEDFRLKIGYRFTDVDLLRRALTHRSYGASNNERLEFLGDSVLNCLVSLELYARFPDLSEGQLSRLRANIVNDQALAVAAKENDFGAHLRLGEGELKSGGTGRTSILAGSLEALVGAAFLDGGIEPARDVVRSLLGRVLDAVDPATSGKDPKTLLQEYLQARKRGLPQYAVVATLGEAHEQHFQVECVIAELGIRSLGEGASRRSAEQEAAREAYELATRA